ncbi:interleukin-11 [Zootoca vivipara]|uniref:interleukin-11 n=1 Tax=Zootoca vivipara TaxID=8524 RepID=UPI00159266F6|nr:interleukin-11 [Zootoca vivipara]
MQLDVDDDEDEDERLFLTELLSTSCLCQVLVVVLSLCEALWGAPAPRPKPTDFRSEFDSVVHMSRNLLSDAKNLFNHFKNRYPAEGEHKLDTLPVLTMTAVELANIQVSVGLTRLSSDLQCYQRHFEWLRRAAPLLLRPMEHDITLVHTRLERLLKRLEHLMTKLSLSRPNPTLPTLPAHGTHWTAVQAGHAIAHSFHLYLDWASRVLVLIRNKL